MSKSFGWKPSSGNLNVSVFSQSSLKIKAFGAAATNTNEYEIPNNFIIFDQGNCESCVENAICAALTGLKLLTDGYLEFYSRLLLYWNARVYENMEHFDNGSYVHAALDTIKNIGISTEDIYPYDTTKVLNQPPILAYKNAIDFTNISYSQITSSGSNLVSDVVAALKANHFIVFGTVAGKDFEAYENNPDPNFVFNPPTNQTDQAGGHALCIVGFRQNASGGWEFKIRNSWGSNFGIGGYCWFSEAYLTWSSTSDIFAITSDVS